MQTEAESRVTRLQAREHRRSHANCTEESAEKRREKTVTHRSRMPKVTGSWEGGLGHSLRRTQPRWPPDPRLAASRTDRESSSVV